MSASVVPRAAARRLPYLALTLLALGAAGLPAAAPYLFGDGLPRTNDALPHLYRVFVLDRMVRAGELWPRWLPDLVHGFGFPVFNFSPPFAHWLVELLHLPGLPLTVAYRLSVFAHFWLGMAGAYFLGRRWFSPAAGWALAIAYSYSPYLLYDAHVRGGLQESQALAFLPWLLLALSQAGQRRRWIALAALAFAATLLSHYPVTFQAMIPIGVWLLFVGWRRGWRALVGPAMGLVLGFLLSAFAWLPSLVEMGYTQADLRISQGYHFADNFLPLRQMLAWPYLPADPALLNPPVVRALPVVALLLAALCFLWGRKRLAGERRWQALIWAALLLLSVWFITPAARFAWETLPLLAETFYPWRFLGVASLAGAILLALGVHLALAQSRRPLLLLGAVTAVLVIAAIPWLYPPREPVAAEPGLAELYRFEAPPLFIGTTTVGEFLPRWVEELPDTAALRDEQLATGNAERLLPAEGVAFERLGGPVWDAAYRVEAQQPATLLYRQFYFPGWRAELDGAPLSLAPSQPHGLISFSVPAGEHELRLTFGSTPPRRLGWLLAALGAAGVLLIVAVPRLPLPAPYRQEREDRPAIDYPYAGLLIAALVGALWLCFSHVETPLRRATLGETGVAGRPAIEPLDFAGEVRLLSLEAPEGPVAAGDPIPITLSLRALRPIGVPYLFGVDVVDDDGIVWSGARARPADWRFIAGEEVWPLDGYRLEPFVLRLLDGAPPGVYRYRIGLVREDTGQTVALHEAGRLMVDRPARGERPLEEGMVAHEEAAAAGLQLLGSRADRREAAPGDPVRVALLWQVVDPALAGVAGQVRLRLEDNSGQAVLETERPLAGSYPAAQWQAGDRLRTEIVLRLPASTPSGEYAWRASLATADGDAPAWALGNLNAAAPERSYTVPPVDIRLDEPLGEMATLLGADVSPTTLIPGGALEVTLVWRAEQETESSYHVFLHLLGPDGAVVAQSDGEPAGWTRPTTGWLPGEVIGEQRRLALPPELPAGDYRLVAGLYEPESGRRLLLPDGTDMVVVSRMTYP